MLKNLIKYDFKWLFKNIMIFHCIGLCLAIIGRLIDFLPDSIFFKVIGGICKGAAISMFLSGLINCVIRSWVRMINNLYKDESYLTHTLPVSKNTHFLSKVLVSIISISISFIILVIGLIIMYYSENALEVIKQSMNLISAQYNISIVPILLLCLLLLLIEIIYLVLLGYFGIIHGYSHNNKKLGKSFLYAIVFYGIVNVIYLSVIFVVALFDKSLFNVIFKATPEMNYSSLISLLIIISILYCAFCGLLYYLSNKKLNKGVNVD